MDFMDGMGINEERRFCSARLFHGQARGNYSAMPTEPTERRRQPRTNLSQVVFIRPVDSRLHPDSCTTFNVSQGGVYLATLAGHYAPGVSVYLTSDFQPGSPMTYAMTGVVVRVQELEDDKWGVAIHIFSPSSSTVQ
jgi:hypothetical protein